MSGFFSSAIGRVLTALVLPVAWGLFSAWLFERVRARREPAPGCEPRPPRRGRRRRP